MNRLDDGKEWKAQLIDGCWQMRGPDGTLQRITVENPMLEVAYTSWREQHDFVTSCMRQLERECQSTYEVIPVEDIELRVAFHTFHNNVSDMVKDTRKMQRL